MSPAAVLWQAMRFVGVGVANALLTLRQRQLLVSDYLSNMIFEPRALILR